jgi:hypothetical protein
MRQLTPTDYVVQSHRREAEQQCRNRLCRNRLSPCWPNLKSSNACMVTVVRRSLVNRIVNIRPVDSIVVGDCISVWTASSLLQCPIEPRLHRDRFECKSNSRRANTSRRATPDTFAGHGTQHWSTCMPFRCKEDCCAVPLRPDARVTVDAMEKHKKSRLDPKHPFWRRVRGGVSTLTQEEVPLVSHVEVVEPPESKDCERPLKRS